MVKLILQQEPDLNFADRFNRTPLHHACNSGNYGVVKMLLDNGQNNKGTININA